MAKTIDLVRECLKAKKMTQTELAESLGEDVRVINQQLNKQQDLKTSRFLEVMEHIGYRVEVVDNNGIRKISDMGGSFDREKDGLYYMESEDGIIGIRCKSGEVTTEKFGEKGDCFDWLLSDAQ